MIRSARLPGSREPTSASHFTIDAAVRVAMETRSRSVRPNPSTSLTVFAIFSSFSTFWFPECGRGEPGLPGPAPAPRRPDIRFPAVKQQIAQRRPYRGATLLRQDREILRPQASAVNAGERRTDRPLSLRVLQCQKGGAGFVVQPFTEVKQQA